MGVKALFLVDFNKFQRYFLCSALVSPLFQREEDALEAEEEAETILPSLSTVVW
jgi:hypothetical protein